MHSAFTPVVSVQVIRVVNQRARRTPSKQHGYDVFTRFCGYLWLYLCVLGVLCGLLLRSRPPRSVTGILPTATVEKGRDFTPERVLQDLGGLSACQAE